MFLDTRATFDDIRSLIELSYKGKYRCIDSSKGDYKAVHIYFKESNQAFPWELQIWNKCDVERNFASHKEYKQAYTIWEEENKKGGTVYD